MSARQRRQTEEDFRARLSLTAPHPGEDEQMRQLGLGVAILAPLSASTRRIGKHLIGLGFLAFFLCRGGLHATGVTR